VLFSRGTSCPLQNEWRLDGSDRVRGDAGAEKATVSCTTGLTAAAVEGSGASATLALVLADCRRAVGIALLMAMGG